MQIRRFVAAIHKVWTRIGDVLLAACCFLLSLALYVQTLAPSVATLFDDSLEFPLVAFQLAIAHPTGYPLYTLLGKLFTLGPGGNIAWSVNLLSAFCGALTVALIYLVVRELTRRRLPFVLGWITWAPPHRVGHRSMSGRRCPTRTSSRTPARARNRWARRRTRA